MTPSPAATRAVLVGSVAGHDINNELTIIASSVAMALESVPPGHQLRNHLLEIQRASQRIAWIASGLINYAARRGVAEECAKPLSYYVIESLRTQSSTTI